MLQSLSVARAFQGAFPSRLSHREVVLYNYAPIIEPSNSIIARILTPKESTPLREEDRS